MQSTLALFALGRDRILVSLEQKIYVTRLFVLLFGNSPKRLVIEGLAGGAYIDRRGFPENQSEQVRKHFKQTHVNSFLTSDGLVSTRMKTRM